jgi:predicted Zn-dependent protease with MMP-like domain
VIRIEKLADEETLGELGFDSESDLTGLYHGRPVSEQSIWSSGELRPTIFLFGAPLLCEWVGTGLCLKSS